MVREKEFVLEGLKIGIGIETKGKKFYSEALKEVEDPKGKETLDFLSKEEERHLKFIRDLMGSFKKSDKEVLSKILKGFKSLPKKPKIFPEKKEYVKNVRASKGDKKILREAKKVEERSIKFYKDCSEKVNSEDYKKIFDVLVREERKHLEWIEFMRDALNVHGYWSGIDEYFSFDG